MSREEALRPCAYIGYDRNKMGLYFMDREAYELAESQFKRAIWLNPYEAAFKLNYAVLLFRCKRFDEAKQVVADVLGEDPKSRAAICVWRQMWPNESPPSTEIKRNEI